MGIPRSLCDDCDNIKASNASKCPDKKARAERNDPAGVKKKMCGSFVRYVSITREAAAYCMRNYKFWR